MLKDGMGRKIFQPKKEEVKGECRKPNNYERHDLYC
jgi:hypothetical protein